MSYYRRSHAPGATWFFTVNTYRRQPILTHPDAITALRTALHSVREQHPFKIDAMVVMPDHLHAIWTLPPGDANFAIRWSLIKRQVSQAARHLVNQTQSASRVKRREINFWQRRYWEHQIRNDADFDRHVDYAHYNPVKHGHVERVIDWPYSTFQRYVRLGICPAEWAGGGELVGDFGE